jgi:hypothetical protein
VAEALAQIKDARMAFMKQGHTDATTETTMPGKMNGQFSPQEDELTRTPLD